MTWTTLVAYVRAAEQCDEREARRQIGNAIADRRLFARWADKPKIPPMPGSKLSSIMPRTTGRVLSPDDSPLTEAAYWLECVVDPTCADRVLEPPIYDPGMVNARTAKRLDKERRFRKPIFVREHTLHLWPDAERVSDFDKKPLHEAKLTKPAFREEAKAQYEEWIKTFLIDHRRYPSREEDHAWGSERGFGRIRIRELRKLLPEKVRKGGRPKKQADAKLVKK